MKLGLVHGKGAVIHRFNLKLLVAVPGTVVCTGSGFPDTKRQKGRPKWNDLTEKFDKVVEYET